LKSDEASLSIIQAFTLKKTVIVGLHPFANELGGGFCSRQHRARIYSSERKFFTFFSAVFFLQSAAAANFSHVILIFLKVKTIAFLWMVIGEKL
jgi:hypothetical protein